MVYWLVVRASFFIEAYWSVINTNQHILFFFDKKTAYTFSFSIERDTLPSLKTLFPLFYYFLSPHPFVSYLTLLFVFLFFIFYGELLIFMTLSLLFFVVPIVFSSTRIASFWHLHFCTSHEVPLCLQTQ